MTCDTINDAVTRQGGMETLLAGRYRVVRQLGQGGMGSVWLAEDTQLDGKRFAIKMLPTILVSNKRAYRQLKDEALVAMRLVHPNIVQIRAFEENNGNPFLVMDYIEGRTLDDCLADWENLSASEVVSLLKPVAAALDYAHTQGVVHRDIKPSNIMVRKDGVPFVMDFGIAREMQETITRVTGKLSSGTLLYMSPEQLNGAAPTPAQDIYSFAAMAYECLKGEPPFVRGQIEFQILNNPPPPLRSDDAPVVANSVMAGLAKKPESRPQTCAAVLEGDASCGDAEVRNDEDSRVSTYAEITVDKESVERVETVGLSNPTLPHGMSSSPRSPKRNVAVVVLPIICVIAVLLVLVGLSWHRAKQRKQEEWRRIVAAQKAEEAVRRQEKVVAERINAERKAKAKEDVNKAIQAFESGDWRTGKELSFAVDKESNTKLQLYLGMCWDSEENTPGCSEKNDNAAVVWYEKASVGGELEASRRLWKMLWTGRGVASNPDKAMDLALKCAKSGDAYCQYEYGMFIETMGEASQKKILKDIVGILEKETDLADEQSCQQSASALVHCSDDRFNFMVKNLPETVRIALGKKRRQYTNFFKCKNVALEWYEKAAQQGMKEAQDMVTRIKAGKEEEGGKHAHAATTNQSSAEKEEDEQCKVCNGKGEIEKVVSCPQRSTGTCPNCKGKGFETCWQCDGNGVRIKRGVKVKCWKCEGKGHMTCDTCKGVGWYSIECHKCNGTGFVTEKHKCDKCGGKGVVRGNN